LNRWFQSTTFDRWLLLIKSSTRHPLRFLFLPAAAVALIAQLAVLWSVVAGRAPASSPGRSARLADITWVLLPTLVLGIVLWLTWMRMGAEIALEPSSGIPV